MCQFVRSGYWEKCGCDTRGCNSIGKSCLSAWIFQSVTETVCETGILVR